MGATVWAIRKHNTIKHPKKTVGRPKNPDLKGTASQRYRDNAKEIAKKEKNPTVKTQMILRSSGMSVEPLKEPAKMQPVLVIRKLEGPKSVTGSLHSPFPPQPPAREESELKGDPFSLENELIWADKTEKYHT